MLCFVVQSLAQKVAFQKPYLVSGVIAGDLLSNLCIEVRSRCTCALARYGKSVFQYKNAECQQTKLVCIADALRFRAATIVTINPVKRCEEVLAVNRGINKRRGETWCVKPFVLNLFLDCSFVNGHRVFL